MAEQTTAMRKPFDRLRNAILLELILLSTITPLLSHTMDRPATEMGALSIGISLFAIAWNYVYNVMFDYTLVKLGLPLYPRSFKMRIAHVLFFEAGFIAVAVPTFMIIFSIGFWQAFMMEMGFVIGIPIVALGYNYLYDRVFPPPVAEVAA